MPLLSFKQISFLLPQIQNFSKKLLISHPPSRLRLPYSLPFISWASLKYRQKFLAYDIAAKILTFYFFFLNFLRDSRLFGKSFFPQTLFKGEITLCICLCKHFLKMMKIQEIHSRRDSFGYDFYSRFKVAFVSFLVF